jgi:predicted kinase
VNVLRRLVYVSGAPGSGKSTLAAPLAAELGYALLGKDIIKETLHGVLGPPDLDRARSRELGAASMELLWALAARSPQVVIEANFRPYSDYERNRLTALGGVQVEVHCACPPELAVARYNARPRHPVHVQTSITPDDLAEFDRPVGIGALVTVDATAPVDVPAIAARVRSLLLSRKRGRLRERRSAARRSAARLAFQAFALRASCCYLALAMAGKDSGSLCTFACTQRSIIMPLAHAPPLGRGLGRMGRTERPAPDGTVSDGTLGGRMALRASCCYLSEWCRPVRGCTAWAVVGRRGVVRATVWAVSPGCWRARAVALF